MDKVTAKIVIDSAKEGDAIARDIFDTYVDSLIQRSSQSSFSWIPRWWLSAAGSVWRGFPL
jgi:N-acetylglucosamine kinase-like BadF-type ATPase